MTDTLTETQLASARARTHERINDLIVTPPRRSRKLPALALAVTAAAAAAVAFAPGGAPTRPAAASAATVLRGLKPQPLPALQPGQYYAVRVVQREAKHPERALDLRYWADANGEGRSVSILDGKERADTADATSIPTPPESTVQQEASDGKVTTVPPGGKIERTPVNTEQPRLRDFPTEPQALAAKMRELASRSRLEDGSEPTTRDYVLAASQMITDRSGTPPDVLRAVFGFLSGLPGMKLVGEVTDPLGRPGVAVAADGDPEIHENVGVELIVDPDTGRPLAMIHYRGDVDHPWLEMTRTEGVVKDTQTLPG